MLGSDWLSSLLVIIYINPGISRCIYVCMYIYTHIYIYNVPIYTLYIYVYYIMYTTHFFCPAPPVGPAMSSDTFLAQTGRRHGPADAWAGHDGGQSLDGWDDLRVAHAPWMWRSSCWRSLFFTGQACQVETTSMFSPTRIFMTYFCLLCLNFQVFSC